MSFIIHWPIPLWREPALEPNLEDQYDSLKAQEDDSHYIDHNHDDSEGDVFGNAERYLVVVVHVET